MKDRFNIDALSREYTFNRENYESASGVGSTLHGTRETRTFIERVVREQGIRSIVDVPCGDFNWMRKVALPLECSYLGLDIVPALIGDNIARFPHVRFAVSNAVTDRLPPCEMVICRDFLFHLPFGSIKQVLRNIRLSGGARWLLSTTYQDLTSNTELSPNNLEVAWGFRPINLTIAPFNLPPPLDSVIETDFNRSVGLFPIEAIPGE